MFRGFIYLCVMKNIVFDLGGVVFARDPKKCEAEFVEFFSFIRDHKMPLFWEEYDRGTLTLEQVKDILCREKKCSRDVCDRYLSEAIGRQEAIPATERLVGELKTAGYRLYVLSNMSREFIDFLRRIPVYRNFDGEVVSCEEHMVKPEPQIYSLLLDRFRLDPFQTLFIDDRQANLDAAAELGIQTFHFDYRHPEESCDKLRGMLL